MSFDQFLKENQTLIIRHEDLDGGCRYFHMKKGGVTVAVYAVTGKRCEWKFVEALRTDVRADLALKITTIKSLRKTLGV